MSIIQRFNHHEIDIIKVIQEKLSNDELINKIIRVNYDLNKPLMSYEGNNMTLDGINEFIEKTKKNLFSIKSIGCIVTLKDNPKN